MLCRLLMYNKVNQLYVYTYPHIPSLLRLPSTLPIPPLSVVTKHRADLPVLCSCFPLAILHLVVYIFQCYSFTWSQHTLPPPCVLKSILYVWVFIPVLAPRFIRTILFCLFVLFCLSSLCSSKQSLRAEMSYLVFPASRRA